MPGTERGGDDGGMTAPVRRSTTAAYYAQAVISFGVSVLAMGIGIAYLSAGAWIRAFLALGLLYVVTSAFTLAKVIRDRLDEDQVVSRVDRARLDKLLAEHDPFRVDTP
ncbi:hypothetical protein ABH941_000496 [Streptacidiphilus sp. EB103A]